jgi:hypothetical protein
MGKMVCKCKKCYCAIAKTFVVFVRAGATMQPNQPEEVRTMNNKSSGTGNTGVAGLAAVDHQANRNRYSLEESDPRNNLNPKEKIEHI